MYIMWAVVAMWGQEDSKDAGYIFIALSSRLYYLPKGIITKMFSQNNFYFFIFFWFVYCFKYNAASRRKRD